MEQDVNRSIKFGQTNSEERMKEFELSSPNRGENQNI